MKRTNQPYPANGCSISGNQPEHINIKEFNDYVLSCAGTFKESTDHRIAATVLNELAKILVNLTWQLLQTANRIGESPIFIKQIVSPETQKTIDEIKQRAEILLTGYTIRPIDLRIVATDSEELVSLTDVVLNLALKHIKVLKP